MQRYLLFTLYGPFSSWGDIAVGEVRPSIHRPTKSSLMGLVAAALGIDRYDEESHLSLMSGYTVACLIANPGIPIVDYHTVQAPPKNKRDFPTRKAELGWYPKNDFNTLISRRAYRMDSVYEVALSENEQSSRYNLEAISSALQKPAYTLYLGRKASVLSLPLDPEIVVPESLAEVFRRRIQRHSEILGTINMSEEPEIIWEESQDTNAGFVAESTHTVRDVVLSRTRWQFDTRKQNAGRLNLRNTLPED